MTPRSRIALALQRVLLRTSRTPLRAVWTVLYRALARLGSAYIARGQRGTAVYARGSLADGDLVAGLSDVDLAFVLPRDPARLGAGRERAAARWERLREASPLAGVVIERPRIYEDGELQELAGASAFSYGLDGHGDRRTAYFGENPSADRQRMLERPGLYSGTADWLLLRGSERRPLEPARDPQDRRMAAWLELLAWWQFAFELFVYPTAAFAPLLCVKLVAEPARIWLWLAHGERVSGRAQALQLALERLPEEENAVRLALELHDSLPRAPEPPLREVLPALVRLSNRIADLIAAEIADAGATEVRLAGAEERREDGLLPLCDWRALVWSVRFDQAFAPFPGDPSDAAALAAAAKPRKGPYQALRAGSVLVLPSTTWWRTRMRAVQCPATDPVSFALMDGRPLASFPNVRGWSALDTAGRAVAERRASLREEPTEGSGRELGALLACARAALFLESLEAGDPELPLTAAATTRALAARSGAAGSVADEALGAFRAYVADGAGPPESTVAALRRVLLGLPAYA